MSSSHLVLAELHLQSQKDSVEPTGPKARVSKGIYTTFHVQISLMFNGCYMPDFLVVLIKVLQINAYSPRKEHYRKSSRSYCASLFYTYYSVLKNVNFETLVWASFLSYIESDIMKTRTEIYLIFETPFLHATWVAHLLALICIYSSCFVSAAPGSPAIQKEVLLSGLEREIICVSLKRDPKNGFGK